MTDNAENAPAVLEGKIPFEEMVYIEGDDAGQYFIQNVRTEFTATLVHSRKVGIRALVEMRIGMEKLADEEDNDRSGKPSIGLQKISSGPSAGTAYNEERYIPDQGGDHAAGTKESVGQLLFVQT